MQYSAFSLLWKCKEKILKNLYCDFIEIELIVWVVFHILKEVNNFLLSIELRRQNFNFLWQKSEKETLCFILTKLRNTINYQIQVAVSRWKPPPLHWAQSRSCLVQDFWWLYWCPYSYLSQLSLNIYCSSEESAPNYYNKIVIETHF